MQEYLCLEPCHGQRDCFDRPCSMSVNLSATTAAGKHVDVVRLAFFASYFLWNSECDDDSLISNELHFCYFEAHSRLRFFTTICFMYADAGLFISPHSCNHLPIGISRSQNTSTSTSSAEKPIRQTSTPSTSSSHQRRRRSRNWRSASKSSASRTRSTSSRSTPRTRRWRSWTRTRLRRRRGASCMGWASARR